MNKFSVLLIISTFVVYCTAPPPYAVTYITRVWYMTKSGGYRTITLDQEAIHERGRVSGKHIRLVMVQTDKEDPFTTAELKFDVNKMKYVNEKIKTLTPVRDSDVEDISTKGLNIYLQP